MKTFLTTLFLICPLPALAAGVFDGADVAVLGEVHDNPTHHAVQAELVEDIAPKAIVFEMLTQAQAEAHVPGGDEATLRAAFAWEESGWPDFAMYYPIFAAAPEAQIFGAGVPREAARAVMQTGVVTAFEGDPERYGLASALASEEQSAREAHQLAAHCDAMPAEMLPLMVDIQRLRDAELARVSLEAFEATGGPVVVITGNGHAREDWGMPVYLSRAAPELSVVTLGQSEDGRAPQGVFDLVEDAPSIERPDPCAAFR